MASLKSIEQKKAKAIADANRKLDLIMEKLGIVDTQPVTEQAGEPDAQPVDVEPEAKPKGKSK